MENVGVHFFLLVFWIDVGYAEIYKWKDDRGITHFTDNISKAPFKYQQNLNRSKSSLPSSRPSSLSCNNDITLGTDEKATPDILLQKLANHFPVKFVYRQLPSFTWKLNFQTAGPSDYSKFRSYLKLFCEEFRKYPVSFIRKTKLSTVVFVKNLFLNGQTRGGIPDYKKNVLVLDFDSASYNQTYLRHIIHHEFYHLIEYAFHRNVYWKDPVWAGLNSKAFRYGQRGIANRSSNMFALNHPKKGFVNLYSLSALEEDKGEIYACLLLKNEYQKLALWGQNDRILLSKIDYMKSFLENVDSNMRQAHWR